MGMTTPFGDTEEDGEVPDEGMESSGDPGAIRTRHHVEKRT
jgi:hypothetical protein